MSRSSGTYTAPSSSWNPAVEGTVVDETDWNALLDDIETALTDSVYTGGLGSTDNRLVRTDGTDTKKVQGSGVTVDDSDNITTTGSITVGNTGLVVGSSTPFSDSSGTLTLQNVDALDATTKATIEAAIDTLANLTSIQGRTVTLSDPGANAFFGWDDSIGAYEILTKNEALAILGGLPSSTSDLLAGEEGIVFDFLYQTAAVNDYNDTLSTSGRPDDLLTVTRASTATYVGRDRLLATASTNTLRYDYNPATGEPRGVLLEGSATNLLLRSAEFDNASWNKNEATVTANAGTGPFGTATADKIIPSTTNTGSHTVDQSVTVASGATVCFSTFLKADGYDFARLRVGNSGYTNAFQITVNLATGAVDSAASAYGTASLSSSGIEDYGGGFYRVWISGSIPSTTTYFAAIFVYSATGSSSFAGDGTSGILVEGAQLETGSAPTSYIPTTSATASRSADSVSIATSLFPLSATQGTLFVDGVRGRSDGTPFSLSDGTSNERIYAYLGAASAIVTVVDGGASQAAPSASYGGAAIKLAFAYRENDFSLVVGGGTPSTDTSGTLPTVTTLKLTDSGAGASQMWGYIRRVMYVSRRMTNTEIQALTA